MNRWLWAFFFFFFPFSHFLFYVLPSWHKLRAFMTNLLKIRANLTLPNNPQWRTGLSNGNQCLGDCYLSNIHPDKSKREAALFIWVFHCFSILIKFPEMLCEDKWWFMLRRFCSNVWIDQFLMTTNTVFQNLRYIWIFQ